MEAMGAALLRESIPGTPENRSGLYAAAFEGAESVCKERGVSILAMKWPSGALLRERTAGGRYKFVHELGRLIEGPELAERTSQAVLDRVLAEIDRRARDDARTYFERLLDAAAKKGTPATAYYWYRHWLFEGGRVLFIFFGASVRDADGSVLALSYNRDIE